MEFSYLPFNYRLHFILPPKRRGDFRDFRLRDLFSCGGDSVDHFALSALSGCRNLRLVATVNGLLAADFVLDKICLLTEFIGLGDWWYYFAFDKFDFVVVATKSD